MGGGVLGFMVICCVYMFFIYVKFSRGFLLFIEECLGFRKLNFEYILVGCKVKVLGLGRQVKGSQGYKDLFFFCIYMFFIFYFYRLGVFRDQRCQRFLGIYRTFQGRGDLGGRWDLGRVEFLEFLSEVLVGKVGWIFRIVDSQYCFRICMGRGGLGWQFFLSRFRCDLYVSMWFCGFISSSWYSFC